MRRAVIFDLWDTLTDPAAQAGRGALTAEVGVLLGADGDQFARAVKDSWLQRCRGELGDLNATLREMCRRLGVCPSDEQLAAAEAHRLATQAAMLQFRPGVDALLARLRADGWRLGLLSDSSCETETIWAGRAVRNQFDAVAFSCSEGRSKPDPRLFRRLLERLDADPARSVYVADGRSGELAAAARLGLRSIQLVTGVQASDSESWNGESIGELADLPDRLAPQGPEIRTERLLMRRWRDDDLAPFAAMNADPEVMRYFPAPLTRERSDELVRMIEAHFAEFGFGCWAAEEVASGAFVGFVGLNNVSFPAPFTPAVETGWRLARPYWGKGYATEAARAAVDFGFTRLGLNEVVAFTAVHNLASRAVMERLGMSHDPVDDFDHPRVPAGHPLRRHVLYRLARPA